MARTGWLDEREQAAWRGLLGVYSALRYELARRLAEDSDLSYQDFEVLATLTGNPNNELRVMELAQALGWEKSRLSHHVARMTQRGLVDKRVCEEDRRGFVVGVTERGMSEIRAAAPGHVEAVRELFINRLSAEQLDALAGIARLVLPQFEGQETSANTNPPAAAARGES